MFTTLNQILAKEPCASGWKKLLAELGKTKADDEPLPLAKVFEINGLDDALWALCTVKFKDRQIRLLAVAFAEAVLPIFEEKYPDDSRPREAIEAARAWAEGRVLHVVAAEAGADLSLAIKNIEGASKYAAKAAFICAWVIDPAEAAQRAAWSALDAGCPSKQLTNIFIKYCDEGI